MAEESRIACRSCRESIIKGASVCPHCRSRQKRSTAHIFTELLKWAAGVAALITLLLSASDLNRLVEVWLEKAQVVEEYTDAAELLATSGDHVNAQQLLEEAAELSPASPEVRDFRIELALKKLRTLMLSARYLQQLKTVHLDNGAEVFDFQGMYQAEEEQEIENLQVEELVKLFARGVVSLEGEQKATLLAHFGWLETLRNFGSVKYEVTKHFVEALQIDPDNYFANAMYGAWLLSPRNEAKLAVQERIALARKHFKTALAWPENKWAKALWLEAMTKISGVTMEHELLHLVQEYKDQGEQFFRKGPASTAFYRNFVSSVAQGSPYNERNEERLQALFNAFTSDDLLNKIFWMSEYLEGCIPGSGCENTDAHVLFLVGRLYERKNDLGQAIEFYRLAHIAGRGSLIHDATRKFLSQAMLKEGKIPKIVLVCRLDRGKGVKENDLLLSYHGKSVPDWGEMKQLNEDMQEGQLVEVTILREDAVINMQHEWLWQNDFAEFIVPEALLKAGRADELRAWLHQK